MNLKIWNKARAGFAIRVSSVTNADLDLSREVFE